MEGDWEEVGRLLLPPPGPQLPTTPISTFVFDTVQELLWVGNSFGRISSYYGTELQRYTSFIAGDGVIHQILLHDKGVFALTSTAIHAATRWGPQIWHITDDEMIDLRCMSYTFKGSAEILVAGHQHQMYTIDVEKGLITKKIHTEDHYSIMKRSRYIIAATEHGSINILDSLNLSVIKTWKAHASGINDMDSQHDFIVTCGYSMRNQNALMLDPLVNCFDIKNMVALPPLPFPSGAAYIRMHPRMSTTCIVVSQHGQMHLIDLMNVNTSNIKQVNTLSYLTMIEIASSGEAMVLADTECNIHLWGPPARVRFAELSKPTKFPEVLESNIQVDWNNNTPLNTVGMPYYREPLLSIWPNQQIYEVGAPPPKLDQQLKSTLKINEWGAYGRNPSTCFRNQVEDTRQAEKNPVGLQVPKFLSEKTREESRLDADSEQRTSIESDSFGIELLSVKADIPVTYRTLDIKYSRYGVADFDFGYYNKTKFSGLETHIPNSYANSLLQVLKYIPMLRNLALQHTATSCINDGCLLCEMGFLFDMLEKAEGLACHATNLLKTFSLNPQAGPLGLLEDEATGSPLTIMLQGLNRFLLDKIAQDWRSIPPHSSAIDQAFATAATTSIRCLNCRSEHTRPGTTFVNELIYPISKPMLRNVKKQKATFSDILKSSIEREITSRGWCNRCNRYQSLATKKTIHSIPAILMLNAAIAGSEAKSLWATPGWVPEEIGITIDQGLLFCFQGNDLKLHLQRGIKDMTTYSLIGIAAEINSGQNQTPHLVSLINGINPLIASILIFSFSLVAHSQPETQSHCQWHLFNDFLVRPISSEEALSFHSWKTPSVIAYQIKPATNKIDNSWKKNLDTSILYIDNNTNAEKTYHPLAKNEDILGTDSVFALDTEFVSTRQPEIEVNADGELETIRPTVYALARVSVIRGSGEKEGLPLIDDYIASKDLVVDYLTSYSGIVKEDLDPQISKHNLVPLKVAYKKLWVLLNLGCKFLGHGLRQDFRVANIYVPKAQVIDTSDFFFITALKRKLSLAFLAWYFLREDIQVTTHDSIEDARTALRLYRKYLEFQDAGILDTMLQKIYRKGKDTGFKPPSSIKDDGHFLERIETPPIPNEVKFPTTPVQKAKDSAISGFGVGWTPGKGNESGSSPLN
ncbi:PAN2-PAN3 deadenylation complex catalytic subunit PAN2 [Golovinomyces cichoracearum]|uniref:PAN2-PAN3 deadenylation complex catalytic subunit PAN2 n=1 Tax=Golovinomyces cichoracearum TaxID=62708 RepID=A0A420IWD0_9PEZI|nr:PAN2-PAN3 deadenylation complex catalytic subunit PAN2 [Golovinomyces cichoracearum]